MPRRPFIRTQLDEPLRRLVQEADRTERPEREAPTDPGLVVGAADGRAERKAGAGAIGAAGGTLDADSSTAIESARGGGAELPTDVGRELEASCGQGLGDVRVHTDARAADLGRDMSARAFTPGATSSSTGARSPTRVTAAPTWRSPASSSASRPATGSSS